MFAALAIGATDTIRTYDLGSRNPPVRTARPDALPTYWVLRRHAKLVGLPFVRGSSGVRLPILRSAWTAARLERRCERRAEADLFLSADATERTPARLSQHDAQAGSESALGIAHGGH